VVSSICRTILLTSLLADGFTTLTPLSTHPQAGAFLATALQDTR
jgi:hypothetical protein